MLSSAINKTARNAANTFELLAMLLYCCSLVQGQGQGQGQGQQQQQQHLKYQQLQYQMQQQYEYQQQQHYQQQFQQKQQQQTLTPTAAFAHKQHEETIDLLSTQPTQLLQTGVSLIVEDGKGSAGSDGIGNGNGNGNRRRTAQAGMRKRKRRPQLPMTPMGATEEDTGAGSGSDSGSGADSSSTYWRGHVEDDAEALRRRKQPLVREPMAALERERDKQRQRQEPTHSSPLDASVQASSPSKAYRRPYGQSKKEQEAPTGAKLQTSVDLKNILKNSGGLSLSEILQQKNLSLDDLLKGKQNALLALQTTAIAPASSAQPQGEAPKKQTHQNKQGVRRLPPAYLSSTTTTTTSSSNSNSNESEEEESLRTRAKFPTLQRLKLFGSSSRESSTTRRTLPTVGPHSTATSTVAPSSTTRLPLYKKRQHMRSTLKPPGLFKSASSSITTTSTTAATTTTQEVDTSTPIFTSTLANSIEEIEEDQEPEQGQEQEQGQGQEEPEPEPEPDSIEVESGESAHTEPPPAPATSPASTASSTSNPRYRLRNASSKESQKRLKDNFIQHHQHHLYDSNVVESIEDVQVAVDAAGEVARSNTTEAAAAAAPQPAAQPGNASEELNYNDDDLENFFDEVESHTHHTRVPAPQLELEPEQEPERAPEPSQAQTPTEKEPQQAQVSLVDDVDDRTDLLELIEDRRSGNRLFKVLEQRNMTLEELIEHRKRGSSQLHLSTIVSGGDEHSRFYPGQKVVLQDNMDIVTAFENFPHFNLMDLKSVKPDEIKTDSQGSSYFTSIIDIEPNDSEKPGGNRGPAYAQTSSASSSSSSAGVSFNQQHHPHPHQKQQQQQQPRGEKSLGFFPSWKTLALASLATATEERNPYFLPPPRLLLDGNGSAQEVDTEPDEQEPSSIDIDLSVSPYGGAGGEELNSSQLANTKLAPNDNVIDEIEEEVARAHDLLDLELSGPGFHRSPAAAAATSVSQQHLGTLYASMPSGIRSAIVASAAIVITALATFLVIFVVCRWKQHRRRKSSYLKTYNAMKSKLPQMAQTGASASRRSSMRQQMEELVIGSSRGEAASASASGGGAAGGGAGMGIASISTAVSCCTPVHQLQRQSSMLFTRDGSATLSTATSLTTTAGAGAGAGGGAGAGAAGTASGAPPPTAPMCGRSQGHSGSSSSSASASLALSLRSAHQKLNTMDPNSPEVQEYLFDTLRKSFDN
ncbi:DNA N6-methyl adenine demethylase [Drosophila obscura]|uniref:DNA N6-methyl adenine demethylase n=1 Tax=Drosophila obscura TaxID=7282 RepID=UPI001BB23BFE|nr:DNA N6-methyl adenine demethylase [Drosophila obscura]